MYAILDILSEPNTKCTEIKHSIVAKKLYTTSGNTHEIIQFVNDNGKVCVRCDVPQSRTSYSKARPKAYSVRRCIGLVKSEAEWKAIKANAALVADQLEISTIHHDKITKFACSRTIIQSRECLSGKLTGEQLQTDLDKCWVEADKLLELHKKRKEKLAAAQASKHSGGMQLRR